ncbi:MAG: hypothetical protein IKM77_00270 [Prevotella sp.]|nr:hypothetical protein [Prevotella sp.]
MRRYISACTYKLVAVVLLLMVSLASSAQVKFFTFQKDSIPVFRGFAVSFDLVGAGLLLLSDAGQYEGALRINLHDEWFPIVELGYGKADHMEEATQIAYKTSAPYFRVGIDRNLLKDKHGKNRLYGGIRYAFTSYKVDIFRPEFSDPTWLWPVSYEIMGAPCKHHWLEVVLGLDAKIFGPLHLGWSVRYKRRLSHSEEGDFGNTWYVPGYGKYGDTRLGGTFNVIIDI